MKISSCLYSSFNYIVLLHFVSCMTIVDSIDMTIPRYRERQSLKSILNSAQKDESAWLTQSMLFSWNTVYTENPVCKELEVSRIFQRQRRILRVWPTNVEIFSGNSSGPNAGLGNQMYGILQGIFLSLFSGAQIKLEWKFSEFFQSTYDWAPSYDDVESIRNGNYQNGPYGTVWNKQDLLVISEDIRRDESNALLYVGHYRDKLCTLLRSSFGLKRVRTRVKLPKALVRKWQSHKELCVHVEACFLKHVLNPTSLVIKTIDTLLQSIDNDTDLIALHVRCGDQEMLSTVPKSKQEDHKKEFKLRFSKYYSKVPYAVLAAAQELSHKLQKNGRKVKYFLATDSVRFLNRSKQIFGNNLITSSQIGPIVHSSYGDISSNLRTIVDFSILSLSNYTISGPWSTFFNTAMLWGYRKNKEIIMCQRSKGEKMAESIKCRQAQLEDYWKGPKPIMNTDFIKDVI